jgi:hypothetical protein
VHPFGNERNLCLKSLDCILQGNALYGHRGHPAHLVTSGLATVVLTMHQKCAVIFGIEVMWHDTDNIEASIHCNLCLGFLARLVEVDCVK